MRLHLILLYCFHKPTAKYRHYICGDFNLPNIDWSAPVSKGRLSHDHFMEFCISLCICQHIMVPTHVDGNTLDLLLCDKLRNNNLVSFDVLPPFSHTCDHDCLTFSLLIPICPSLSSNWYMPNFHKA